MNKDKTQYVDSVKEAIHKSTFADRENGMATIPFAVELEDSYLRAVRKSGSLDHPSIMLFKVIPKDGHTVDYDDISDQIIDALGIYGDISLQFEGRDIKTAVVDTKLL